MVDLSHPLRLHMLPDVRGDCQQGQWKDRSHPVAATGYNCYLWGHNGRGMVRGPKPSNPYRSKTKDALVALGDEESVASVLAALLEHGRPLGSS